MKKFIGTLVMVIALALGVAASAEYTASIEMQDGKIAVNGADSGTLIITSYSENGEKLNGVKTYDISEYKDGVPVADELLPLFSDEKTGKITCMLWNDFAHMEPLAKSLNISDIVTIPAGCYDYDKSANNSAGDRVYFYTDDGKSGSYKISPDTKLYVNGVIYGKFKDGADRFIKDNNLSDIALVDYTAGGSADGIYDSVFVNYYDTAVVDYVMNLDSDKPRLEFSLGTQGVSGSLRMDLTDPDIKYTIMDTDGEKLELSEIKAYDVVSIRRNVSLSFGDSAFYDIIVSRKSEQGTPSSYNQNEETYEINGTWYSVVTDMTGDFDLGTQYTFYFDAFDRIAHAEEIEIPRKIAILDNLYETASSEYKAALILRDGTRKEYTLKTSAALLDAASNIIYGKPWDEAKLDRTKTNIWDRVIEYEVNASNELVIVPQDAMTYALAGDKADGKFRAEVGRLDGYKVSAESTSFILAADENDITAVNYSNLVDGREYSAYLYDRSEAIYGFVILIGRDGRFSQKTQLAVYNKRILRTNSENQEVTAAVVFVDGEERQIDIDSNYTLPNLQNGDPVIYETNSQGEITNIIKVANFIDFDNYNYSGYDNIRNVALESTSNVISLAKNSDGHIEALSDDDGDVDIVFGAVFKGENKSIDLLPITNGKSDMSDIISYTCGDDVKFYEYDSNQRRDSVSVGYASDIINLRVPQNAYVDGQNQEFSWDYTDRDGNAAKLNSMFAFIRCVNAEVKEVYLIIPPYEE